METPSQPPSDIPTPLRKAKVVRSRRWMRRAASIGLSLLVLVMLAGVLAPMTLRCRKSPGSTQALSNARQIGLALFDFDAEYGRFPDASTIAAVKQNNHSDWNLKDRTSNDLFKQLHVAGITTSEEIFYAKVPGTRKPDNVISTEDKALQRGECGFAYIAGVTAECASGRPLVVTPLIPGTLKFDPVPFDGKAIILRADNSAVSYQIRPDGTAIAPGGKDLFDPSQPYWEGAPPDVKWADLPSPSTSHDERWLTWVVPTSLVVAVAILVVSIIQGRKMLLKKYPSAMGSS